MRQALKSSKYDFSRNFIRPTYIKKLFFFLFFDTLIIVFSLYFAFLLRFDFILDSTYKQLIRVALPLFLAVKLLSFFSFRLYRLSWRFVSLKDLYAIIKAVVVASATLTVIVYFFRFSLFVGFPRSIIIVDAVITLVLVSLLRIAKRAFLEILWGRLRGTKGKRTIILGAGNTGEMILRDLQKAGLEQYAPVAFLDDDPNRVGTYLHGVKVAGVLDDLKSIVHTMQATAVIIAIPVLGHMRLRELYATAKEAGATEIKIVPRLYDFHRPEIRAALEDIKIEDLIGRQAVTIDYQEIEQSIADRTVLVTGAAGSIGFELVRQICSFHPRQVILFEIDETDLHRTALTLQKDFPSLGDRLTYVVGDIRDRERVEGIFAKYRPDFVFHAAAYKHVPMMEYNAGEAVKVNMLGTHIVAHAARVWGVERFIMISTDKAVRPTSIMGATKRVAEHICRSLNGEGKTEYISVRFGNVLGSRGSVLPLFIEQMKRGEPLTITHEDMQRYFMTIPEAVSLVLQASVIGRGGDIMVLDMGKPVKIVALAEELLRLHGLELHKDIPLQFIGMRPGEKLFEEILTAEEGTIATRHEKIFIARMTETHSRAQIEEMLERFRNLLTLDSADGKEFRQLLKQYVRWYDETQEQQSVPAVSPVHIMREHEHLNR